MPSPLATILFAAQAAAQITTTMWMYGNVENIPAETASVVAYDGSRTTVAISTETLVIGDTYASFSITAEDYNHVPITMDIECTRADADAAATCARTQRDSTRFRQAECSKYSRSEVFTFTLTRTRVDDSGKPTETATNTVDVKYFGNAPYYCSGSTVLEEEVGYVTTMSGNYEDGGNYMTTRGLVLTAGLEKLGPEATRTAATTSAAAQSISSTGSAGGATPMRTALPALAGMGAAVVAMFL